MRKALLSLALAGAFLVAPLPASAAPYDYYVWGSIGCWSDSATAQAYGRGYMTLRAPGAGTNWTTPWYVFNGYARATVYKEGEYWMGSNNWMSESSSRTHAYCNT